MNGSPTLSLRFGLKFEDLYDRAGLVQVDQFFLDELRKTDGMLAERLEKARENPESFDRKQQAELLVALAPHVEDFIGDLFGITAEVRNMQARHNASAPLYSVKRKFVQRKALTGVKPEQAALIDEGAVRMELEAKLGGPLTEELFADKVTHWLASEAEFAAELGIAAKYTQWAMLTPAGQKHHKSGILFKAPHKLDFMHLVPVESILVNNVPAMRMGPEHWRHREGFALTDHGMNLEQALDQANYCIKCHNQGKDSCSTGLKEKTGEFKHSIFNVPLAGCPLEEKISELNTVKQDGYTIGALGIVTVDNPMTAATGHRICNDCMKACVFQKQEPVDIPQVETRALKDVLSLPWGFEIYSLLTRWNPLNLHRPVPRPQSGYKVLAVGMGPAGFTLSHYLMNDGHMVAGVDGLKIEPLPQDISGVTPHGERVPFRPIHDVQELFESLNDRVLAGFGGVAEYGITVRWDKNFLKLIRLLLERRREFSMFGGVRFGGTLTVDSAMELGFDHIALCMGAGRPTVVPMKNGLVRGVRQASDFLMALQLTGAAKHDSIANLQLRLPVVVIGGGLTAIDTATESLAYYVVQVEKFLDRYEALVADRGEAAVRKVWTAEENETADEFVAHARAIRAERERAKQEHREPRLVDLMNSWGGVTVAYRRRLVDAPSYTLNHEEVAKALEEGIRFAEGLTPDEVEVDQYGHAKALRLKRGDEIVTLPARAILVAAGTQPNTVLAREDGSIELDGKYFRAVDDNGNPVKPERISKPAESHVLMSIRPGDGKALSFFGDLHPSYAGNVVKAMGSAKQGYPVVSRILEKNAPAGRTPEELQSYLNDNLRARVHDVIRLTPNIVEVVVRAPLAARSFQPGQFYRLQNYEAMAKRVDGTVLGMEGLALTGASVEHDAGLLSTIVLEMGGSSDLCAHLQPGEPVILMGPTGEPTETPHRETVLLVGGGLGNAVLFSIGQKLRENGSRVIYIAGYKRMIDRYKIEEIERAADIVIWCCDEAPGFTPTRSMDRSVVMNIVDAIAAYARGDLGDPEIPLNQVDRIIAIGSDGMMAAVGRARHNQLAPYLKKEHHAIGSINSPMQCMMKEICAQCLQIHKDPATGKETIVFSCANQDQSLDHVDFTNLRSRLSQNGTQEKLTKLWIDRCLRQLGSREAAIEV
ncbi:MAG: FAD-dependent oxidoreductase [Acidobacteria bacterium]|nr:FAD-dependent oxidoreductase [Acidobacteriota bacterium]